MSASSLIKFDVAIVGTGPAGGMAACRLAESGLRVILLEKAMLPRAKPCGGAIPASLKILSNFDLTPVVETTVFERRYLNNWNDPITVAIPTAPILMVSRDRFDRFLVERALERGRGLVRLVEGFALTGLEETPEAVCLYERKRRVVKADYLIAADGASSPTARALGLECRAGRGVAIDVEVEVAPSILDRDGRCATFNFFSVPQGYGWVFPKDGRLSCGVLSWGPAGNLRAAAREFLNRSFGKGGYRVLYQCGHPIPGYAGRRQLATPRVCLVGDAAALVDPVTGEGIRFALESGRLAAETILDLVSNRDDRSTGEFLQHDCRRYQSLVETMTESELEGRYRFCVLAFRKAPGFFYRRFVRAQRCAAPPPC